MSHPFTICDYISSKVSLSENETCCELREAIRAGRSLQGIMMGFRILFDEDKLKQGIYQQEDDLLSQGNGVGWPKGTWFQKRLRQVRQQQRRKLAETDFVYECALGTIIVRQSNGRD